MLSDGAANGVLNAIMNGTAYGGGTHYASLHTADPQNTGANEGSITRQAISGAGSAASRQETNNALLRFPAPPAVQYTHIGIWNHASNTGSTYFVWGGPLDTPVTGDGSNDITIAADLVVLKL